MLLSNAKIHAIMQSKKACTEEKYKVFNAFPTAFSRLVINVLPRDGSSTSSHGR